MTTEEYYKANKYTEFDKHDKRTAKFDYYDLIDFAHRYHENELKLLNIPPVIPCDLRAETFKLANKLALAGHGNEAVKLHRISNSLG